MIAVGEGKKYFLRHWHPHANHGFVSRSFLEGAKACAQETSNAATTVGDEILKALDAEERSMERERERERQRAKRVTFWDIFSGLKILNPRGTDQSRKQDTFFLSFPISWQDGSSHVWNKRPAIASKANWWLLLLLWAGNLSLEMWGPLIEKCNLTFHWTLFLSSRESGSKRRRKTKGIDC